MTPLRAGLGALCLLAIQAGVLWLMGQPLMCACGHVSFWHGTVLSPENSQQLSDWYTFSHVIHGVLFYWILTFLAPRLPFAARVLVALGAEVGWELFENTPWLIEHYRQQALAQGYTGDSVLNSVSDSVAMLVGFLAARRLPVLASLAFVLALEGLALYAIRDSLLLNVVNLIHPVELLGTWQAGS